MKELNSQEIEKLNDYARTIQPQHDDDPVRALQYTAAEFGLKEVRESGSVTLYRTHDHEYVNCWYEGVQSSEIEDGGLGFDGQVGLHEVDE